MTRLRLVAALLAVSVNVIAAQPSSSVRVTGPRTVTFSVADLGALPRTTVIAMAHERQATYEGVSIRELLSRVGVPSGEGLRGRELATAVLVTGADDYQVVFGIAEFDPGFTDRVAILADKRNGVALGGDEGPFQLVMSEEKRPARWVRQVVSIDVRPLAR
jgi:hypothetical protein